MKKAGRILALSIFGLLAISILASFVAAADLTFFDPVKDMFTNWEKGALSQNIAKYLFTILIGLLVYSILDLLPFVKGPGKGAVRALISIIVAFLSMAYLTPSQIYMMLASYGTMGFVLGAALPFVIMVFFSIQTIKEGGVGGRVVTKFMWIVLIFFWIWKLVDGMYGISTGTVGVITKVEGFSYLGAIVVAGLYLWFGEKMLLKLLFQEEMTVIAQSLKETNKKTMLAEAATLRRRAQDLRSEGQGVGSYAVADQFEATAEELERKAQEGIR